MGESGLPKVVIFSLGGTITGRASNVLKAAEYKPGELRAEELTDSIPGLAEIADVETKNITQVGSPDIPSTMIRFLAKSITLDLESQKYTGAIITTGTDTMSELATGLFHAIKTTIQCPLILTGAMRAVNALSADGLRNLLDAVLVAIHPDARGRGVLGVMNAKIFMAPFFHKSDANQLEAFTGGEAGPIGRIDSDQVNFFFTASRANVPRIPMNLEKEGGLPMVNVLFASMWRSHGDNDEAIRQEDEAEAEEYIYLMEQALKRGVKGFVLAGEGAGCWDLKLGERLAKLYSEKKTPIVASRRTGTGFVGKGDIYGLKKSCIRGGYYTPEQAKITLQIALDAQVPDEDGTHDVEEIEDMFYGVAAAAA